MIFLLSPDVSAKRKIFYYGLAALAASLVLFSMNGLENMRIARLITVLAISGATMACLPMVYAVVRKQYFRSKLWVVYLICLQTPLALCLIVFLSFLFLGWEPIATDLLIKNGFIVLVTLPVTFVCLYILALSHEVTSIVNKKENIQ